MHRFLVSLFILVCVEQSALCMQRERTYSKRERSSEEDSLPDRQKSKVSSTRYGKAVHALKAEEPPSLFKAASLDQLEAALKKGGKVSDLNQYRETPLHYFVYKNRTDAVRMLLLNGAACGIQDRDGNTVYHTAVHEGEDMVYCLMKSVQGGPQFCTEEFRTWQKSIATSSMIFNRFRVYKDVRLMIVKQLMPKTEYLHRMLPLRYLPYFTCYYGEQDKKMIVNNVFKRHCALIRAAYFAKNKHRETPFEHARYMANRAPQIRAPIQSLHIHELNNQKKAIYDNYCVLLGIPVSTS